MALTTLAKVRQYAGPDIGAEADALLSRLIEVASAAIEEYCSRSFLAATYAETASGHGGNRLFPRHGPITAVSSVTIDGKTIPARTSPLAQGYSFSQHTINLTGYTFDEGVDNVTVVYTAGLAAVPADIEQACIEMVLMRFQARDRIGVSSKSLAGESISFSSAEIPNAVRTVLNRHERVGM